MTGPGFDGPVNGHADTMHRVLVSYVLEVSGDVSVGELQSAVYATSEQFLQIIDRGSRLGEAPVVINADVDPFDEAQAALRHRRLFSRQS